MKAIICSSMIRRVHLWITLFSNPVWQSMFILINVVNLVDLLLRRRPVITEPLEQKLHLLVFNRLKPATGSLTATR